MKSKKIIALLLTAVMLLSMAACGQKTTTDTTTAATAAAADGTASEGTAAEGMVEAFGKKAGDIGVVLILNTNLGDHAICDLSNAGLQEAAAMYGFRAKTVELGGDVTLQVPTMQECGVKNFNISTWYGLFVPSSTPAATVAKLNGAFTKALKSKAVVERLAKQGGEASPTSSAEFAALIREEIPKYARIVKISGARVD